MVKINGSSFALQYKRTTYRPIDSSSVFDTIEDARVYARNTDAEAYFPYAGQLVSTLENGGAVYKLSKDDSIPETDGKRHFKLDPIGSKNDNDDRYVRKDIAETIEKLMTFIEGINVKGTATLNEIMLLKDLVSENFSAGGSGFGIYRDADGNYHLDIDFVDIRKKLSVEDIQVQQSTYVGGRQYNTGGGIICNRVEDKGTYWRCYFKTTDSEWRTVYNTFQEDDQAICETFNLKSGNHYYWRLVTGTGDDYIDLSKDDCASGSDIPLAGDSIVQLGNRTDTGRQGAIVWDSVTAGGPYVRIYNGINSYTMPEPLIDFNTVLSEITARFINQATGKDMDKTLDDMQVNLDIIKQQTDKEYTMWFYDYEPTLSNIPASEWTTAELKAMHDQDLFYNTATGQGYRFESGAWEEITDHLTLKALEDAARAQDTADSKLMVSVHYYDPWSYCGASSAVSATKWGKVSDYEYMDQQLAKMTKFTEAGYGVVIGEYGALPCSDGLKDNTLAYHTAFLDACTKYNLTNCLWDCSGLYKRVSQTFADDDILAMYQEKRQANEEGQDYADVQAAAAAEAAAAAAEAPVTFLQDAVVVDDQTALAWIMWNDGSWALTHSVGDTYNADAISEGLVATNAIITGEGKYTVGLDFTGTAQGYSASVAFAAIGISNGEALYPNYLVNIKEVRINGEIYRLKGRAYTTSDDGVCTRVNLYNEWVTSVPKTARLPGGNLAGATPTPINRNDAVIAEIKTIEIDFEYVPMN